MKIELWLEGKIIGAAELPEDGLPVGSERRPIELRIDGENRGRILIVQRFKREEQPTWHQ